jgi:outer membrane lipoprotein SlyB
VLRLLLISSLLLTLAACAGRDRPAGGVIVDMKGVDPARYQTDLSECRTYADQVDVAGQAGAGAAGGAVVGGLIGAVVDGGEGAARGAGVGAIGGGASGTVRGLEERDRVVKNCLRNRGYAVLN